MSTEDAVKAVSQAWVNVWAAGIEAHPEDWHMLQPIFIEDLDMQRLHGVPEDIRTDIDTVSERARARSERI
jgi:KDO2-lipid IV(A) lauroyltransferase